MPPAFAPASSHARFARLAELVPARFVFLVLGAFTLAFCVLAATDAFKLRPDDGSIWLLGRSPVTILETGQHRQGRQNPLLRNDIILGIAHQIVRSPGEASRVLGAQQPGTTVPYLVEREGRSLTLPVPLTGYRVADRTYVLSIALAAVYMAIGFLVYVKSRDDSPARLFFLLCLCFAVYFMTNLERSGPYWSAIFSRNGGAVARFVLPAFFLHFFLVFPERKRLPGRSQHLGLAVYLLPLVFYARFTYDQFYGAQGAAIGAMTWMVLGLYYLAGLVVLVHSYLSYRDPLLRERVRILTWGTLAAVLPFLVFKIGLGEITARSDLAQLGIIPLVAIPVCFGYSVARYQILQIDFLVKRSLLFNISTVLLLGAWGAVVFWAGSRLVGIIGSSNPLFTVGVTLFAAAVLWPLRNRLQKALEIRLYRSRAEMATLLERFSREIPSLIQQQTLLDRVGLALQQSLELPGLWFYLTGSADRNDSWQRVWPDSADSSRTADPAAEHSLHVVVEHEPPRQIEAPRTLQGIAQRLEPIWIDPSLARRVLNRAKGAGRTVQKAAASPIDPAGEEASRADLLQEQRDLARAGLHLLVPLTVSGRIIGFMALPARPGGEAYQLHEIQLLTIVARQTAMQLENTRLYAEELAKQTLEEEMRLARSIQSRLLPGSIPQLEGVQIDAVNISSKTVSGDYYDLIQREDGQLVLIIADVSGKGMPASLLASNLQASLRAQCDHWDAPGAILQRVNRQLHASTDSRHFATAFLAFFDPSTGRLRYSTGGHDAPVLINPAGEIVKLDDGGLPLGAFDFGEYDEGQVHLGEGDLLFLYTDGLTETRSPDGEDEYGVERLVQFLRANRNSSVAELLADLERELQSYRKRPEADDDITLIALKIAPTTAPAAGTASAAGAQAASPAVAPAASRASAQEP